MTLAHSRDKREIKHFHDWRKRAKYLRYQIDVLNRIWPEVMEVWEDELHELTDLTGFMHDLHNLEQIAKKRKPEFASQEEEILFFALIGQHQKIMKQHALLLGRKIYALKANAFLKQVQTFWTVFEKEKSRESLPDDIVALEF